MELHQIRYFIALARSLNFTRAAEQCSISQPALTKAVQKLEQTLGGPLIYRERQLTQLTDLGKLVLPMLERAYAAAESVRASAEEFQRKEIAALKVALSACVSASVMEAPFAEMVRFMPGLQVELVETEPGQVGDSLLNGDANAAIVGEDIGGLPPRIDHWRLFEEEFLVLMPIDSDFAAYDEVPLEALAQATWLNRGGACVGRTSLRDLFPADLDPQVGHRCRQLGHVQSLVSAGLGLALWPEHAPYSPSLTTRPIAGGGPRRAAHLLLVAGRRYSPALETLVKIARLHDWRGAFPTPPLVDLSPRVSTWMRRAANS